MVNIYSKNREGEEVRVLVLRLTAFTVTEQTFRENKILRYEVQVLYYILSGMS